MTPRENLLALADRLEGPDARPSAHMMLDVFTIQVPMLSVEDRKAAAKAIRVLVEAGEPSDSETQELWRDGRLRDVVIDYLGADAESKHADLIGTLSVMLADAVQQGREAMAKEIAEDAKAQSFNAKTTEMAGTLAWFARRIEAKR